jgi:uncharacterized membrane protein
MMIRNPRFAERLRSSLWIIPALCTLLAILLASLLVELDKRQGGGTAILPWFFEGEADSARVVLSTIAGSMITVAGTVYSITIVVLTLASAQFAPRILRSFMRDRGNQLVLGFFVATFTYSLLVLRDVSNDFVPGTAVAGGVLLALISLGMLIYFIDHIFHGIQVSSIISRVANETVDQIERLYPHGWEQADMPPRSRDAPIGDWASVPAAGSGYLQYVEYDYLFDLAVREDIVLKEDRSVGAFIIASTPLAYIFPAEKLTPALQARINEAFGLGSTPTLQQDVAYGIRQIVDIGLKAISPAVNDPTTCLNCIDHLGVILTTLACRQIPDLDRIDATGRLRIIVRERTFQSLTRLAFDQLRHYGAGDPIIVIRMLDVITQVAALARNPDYRKALNEQVEHIASASEQKLSDTYEIDVVRAHISKAKEVVGV